MKLSTLTKAMMKLVIFVFFLTASSAGAKSNEGAMIITEFLRFYQQVKTLTPDGKIGDFMNYKKIENYEVLWDLGETPQDYSVIKFFNEHHDGTENFFVTYYLSDSIIPGTFVIRRIVGPLVGAGWRNDTVDFQTAEYLGYQGASEPTLNSDDQALIRKLGIELVDSL